MLKDMFRDMAHATKNQLESTQTHWLQWTGYTSHCHYCAVLVPGLDFKYTEDL